jgi:bridging integrator 3
MALLTWSGRSGFKKAVNRAGTTVMMKTGHVEKTIDRDYEIEERRFRTMESAANRLQKEAKGYLDSLRGIPFDSGEVAKFSYDCITNSDCGDN